MIKENSQQPLPMDPDTKVSLLVHSIFSTIQGEGPFAGRPSIFIRLAGCNIQCPFCDTEYIQGAETRTVSWIVATIEQIIEDEELYQMPLIVITGGEPFRQYLYNLIRTLIEDVNLEVQVETNGIIAPRLPSTILNHPHFHIVCSPKTHKINDIIANHACFKYVVTAGSVSEEDGLPVKALNHKVRHRVYRPGKDYSRKRIFIQPADLQNEKLNSFNLIQAIFSCKTFGYSLCLQQHKIINLP